MTVGALCVPAVSAPFTSTESGDVGPVLHRSEQYRLLLLLLLLLLVLVSMNTHPFHPLAGKDFEFVVHRLNWVRTGSGCATRTGSRSACLQGGLTRWHLTRSR